MNSTRFFLFAMYQLLVCVCFISCSSPQTESFNAIPGDSIITDERGRLNDSFNTNQTARSFSNEKPIISFRKDTIHIRFKNAVQHFRIPYSSPADQVLPCNCIAVTKTAGKLGFNEYYFLHDTLLLIPVLDFPERVNLFVLNLNSGNLLTEDKTATSMLTTYLTWFVYKESSDELLAANSFDLEMTTSVHVYKIENDIKRIRTFKVTAQEAIRSDEEEMKRFINEISNNF